MDRRSVHTVAPEAVDDSSSHHHESVPMSSDHVKTSSPVEEPDDQWSVQGQEIDSAAHAEKCLTHTSNAASQDYCENYAVSFTKDYNRPWASGASTPSDSSHESLVVYTPSSLSHVSDTAPLLPGPSEDGVPDEEASKKDVPEEDEQLSSILMIPFSSRDAKARRLTRRCQIHPATIFDRAACVPEKQFEPIHRVTLNAPRYVNRCADREIMLVTGGSCTSTSTIEGQDKPTECKTSAGACFIYKPSFSHAHLFPPTIMPFQLMDQARSINESSIDGWQRCLPMRDPAGKIALRLEAQGPQSDIQTHTSNRAKLRAVIAALDFRPWHVEGWDRVVVVTDLEYVAHGATQWISLWIKRRWRSAPTWTKEGKMRLGKKIANRDLWETLQSRIEILHEYGTEVSFWLVPASLNSPLLREAKAAAREAAMFKPDTVVMEEYTRLIGINM